ncbi:MAG: hypothetical protein GY719_41270 [bacterium]|nr:hypothetical protein [bacterium]
MTDRISLARPDAQHPESRQTNPRHSELSPRFFWRLLLVASMIAAAVSLLTTGLGLDRYVAFPLAWSLALAVQLGLFGLAWLIGVGRDARKVWISALYIVTMLFSVTFSYVTLQSEFTKEIRPAEAQRRLFDATRERLTEAVQAVNAGVQQSAEVQLRLASWLDLEKRNGWATRTCEEEEHCYLQGVCDRILRRIGRWEQESGQPYRQGPGEQLIFGTLQTELRTAEQLGDRLTAYRDVLTNGNGVLDDGLDNRERLRRLDGVLNQVPQGDLEAVTCSAATLPAALAYGDHARDGAMDGEEPVYAFQDLMTIFESERELAREDYPTVFALALAFFIDLFVLVVALGASTLEDRRGEGVLPVVDGVPASFEDALQHDIGGWIDASLIDRRNDPDSRQDFIGSILEVISFGREGEARLIPESEEHRRFGHLLVHSKAARVESFVKFNRVGRLFRLEDWVYPALARHLSGFGGAVPA